MLSEKLVTPSGEKVTLIVRLSPGPKVAGSEAPEIENSPVNVVMDTMLKVRPLLSFVNVTGTDLVLPTRRFPKSTELGFVESAARAGATHNSRKQNGKPRRRTILMTHGCIVVLECGQP